MLLRALSVLLCVGSGCSATIEEPGRPPPVPMVAGDVFVLDRDQHLHCLSACVDPTPDPDATYRSVSGQNRFLCAVRTDDTLECWGPNGFGELTPEGRFRDASARTAQACAIAEDGEVVCWGDRAEAIAAIAPPGPWDQIEAYDYGYCVWAEDGTVGCFPPDSDAEFGFGYETFDVDGRIGCGLIGGGEVGCFLGSTSFSTPRYFVKDIDLARRWSCVLMMETRIHNEGELLCSGEQNSPEGRFVDLSVHAGNGCVVNKDEEVLCWGFHWDRGATVKKVGGFP